MDKKIGFIGAGKMATALIAGLRKTGYDSSCLWASSPTHKHLETLKNQWDIQINTDNMAVAAQADILILAVKPKDLTGVLNQLKSIIQPKKTIIISLVAGINAAFILDNLGKETKLCRAMPNLPVQSCKGITALWMNTSICPTDKTWIESIFQSVGDVVFLEQEKEINAVTALSGSGPAYFFLFMQALEEAGIALGLSADLSHALTLKTAFGSAQMAIESSSDFNQLCLEVAPQGGGTEQAIQALKSAAFMPLILTAVQSAKSRYDDILSEQQFPLPS